MTADYRGRFAPSPTGPLHFGSLVAALGSYLDARHHQGAWLVRMEDVDTPRCVPGAADDILRTLETFGLQWDEHVIYQSQRTQAYEQALEQLQEQNLVYLCACTRKEIADSALHGIEGPVYPGTCRNGLPAGKEGRAWRVVTNDMPICFDDALQGNVCQVLERDIGDFVVKRADGLFAYQLAVVVDDAFQHINHIVRGADLLASTPRQIHLMKLLNITPPQYMHLPVVTNSNGEKLSKQTLAAPLDKKKPIDLIIRALQFLHQQPPMELATYTAGEIMQWAILNWNPTLIRGVANRVYEETA